MRVLLTLLLTLPALAGDYEIVTLDCPSKVDYRVCRDVTGDGKNDLVLVAAKEVRLWEGKTGLLSQEPDRKFRLPKGTALFDFGRPRGTTGEDLIVRTKDAYWAIPWTGEPVKLPMPSGPGLPASVSNVLWRGFFRDLDLDRKTDFVDVSLKGYRIRYGSGDEQLLPVRIIESTRTTGQAISARHVARHAIGAWTDGNFNGDMRPDFAVETSKGLRVYLGDAKGRFDAKRFADYAVPGAEDAEILYEDLNRDGQTDVLSVRLKKGRAAVLIGHPRKGLAKPYKFDLSVPGGMRPPVLADLNGDKRPDLALPYVPKASFGDVVRVVARGEFLVKVPVFLNRGGQRPFGASADTILTLPVRVRMGADETGQLKLSGLIIVEYGGDLDGDGRNDLVVTETTKKLAVYRGVNKTVFREEPWTHLAIPDCAAYESVISAAADLNGDELSDIILYYRGGGRQPDQVHLLLSRKN
ncbi:MAG: FG-GAP repeat domain-containing protein [Planctomycetota bacterium]|jgi:hypothetical protein